MPVTRSQGRKGHDTDRFLPVDLNGRPMDPQRPVGRSVRNKAKRDGSNSNYADTRSSKKGRPVTQKYEEADSVGEDLLVTIMPEISCPWVTHDGEATQPGALRLCGEVVASCTLVDHIKKDHLGGRDHNGRRQVRCRWGECHETAQYDSMARHLADTHLALKKRRCLWCGHLQRFHEYHGGWHGSARSCKERTAVLDKLSRAADTDVRSFEQILDELQARGGQLQDIFGFLVAHRGSAANTFPFPAFPVAGPSGSTNGALTSDGSSYTSSEPCTPLEEPIENLPVASSSSGGLDNPNPGYYDPSWYPPSAGMSVPAPVYYTDQFGGSCAVQSSVSGPVYPWEVQSELPFPQHLDASQFAHIPDSAQSQNTGNFNPNLGFFPPTTGHS
ncbi:hypothetical protein BV20DRAFT_981428 [Pilatotrama ljubarskyi]|nr:hypothetical protein BV20DRAFT_981428 [Pilatotrama ljubarskyi]